jgi:LssY C-terminus
MTLTFSSTGKQTRSRAQGGYGAARKRGGAVNFMTVGLAGVAGMFFGAAAVIAQHVMESHNRYQEATRLGRTASASVETHNGYPLTTVTQHGQPGDPVNVHFEATDSQIGAAFASAGWYRADETDLVTALRISADSLLGRPYSTAPISNLFLYGRKEDLAFERPGSSVRQRDHIRLWNTGQQSDNGRPRWVASGTKDVKVELKKSDHLPTHGISPDVDAERDLVVSELAQTGFVVDETRTAGFGRATEGQNGGGDQYFTDGQVTVVTIADLRVPPFASQVRGRLGGQIAQRLASYTRRWLPQEGLDRADREQAKLNQSGKQGEQDQQP